MQLLNFELRIWDLIIVFLITESDPDFKCGFSNGLRRVALIALICKDMFSCTNLDPWLFEMH